MSIPYGYCHCGCGQKTGISVNNNARLGYVKGQPHKFCAGHGAIRKLKPSDYEETDMGYSSPCWIWTGRRAPGGYGIVKFRKRTTNAHRWVYEQVRGELPSQADLDHLCQTPPCVNPAHMEPVTQAENTRRGRSARLTYSDVEEIKRLLGEGQSQRAVATQFGVSQQLISLIKRNKRWAAPGGVVRE